jgi:hypothetical protein
LAPRFIGPFLIVATPFPDVVQVQLPDSYKFVHSTFKVKYVRSLLAHADQEFDPRYPVVEAHPSLIPAIAVLDRGMIARTILSATQSIFAIPCEYLVAHRNGSLESKA